MVHSVEIDRRPEDVFAYVTDPSRFTEWQDAVVSARRQDDGPIKQGSRLALTRRIGKREQTMTSELAAYDSPRSYAFRVLDGPVRAFGNGKAEPVGNGDRTRSTVELDFKGHGIGKLLVPLFVRRQAEKELTESQRKLKVRLERFELERGEEVDGNTVRITYLRVALAPERVPRLLLGREPRLCDASVELVDLGRACALECKRELVAGLARPVGPEALHDLLCVEHEANAARQRRFDVSLTVLRKADAEEAVEGDRARRIRSDDPNGVQIRHAGTLARLPGFPVGVGGADPLPQLR